MVNNNNNGSHARNTPSKSFSRIYSNAPASAQRQILEQTIIPLLDKVPLKHANRVVASARKMAKKAQQIPQIDMAAKRKEIQGLFEELQKESRFASRSSGSEFEALLLEAIESVVEWLNDLWSLGVDFGLDFIRVHSALLTSESILDHVRSLKGGGCQSALMTIYVPVTIRDKSDKVVKEFNELGVANVESAILWIWRDVFLAMLASKNPVHVKLIPELLAEIDDEIGWSGLERLVLGGATYFQDGYDQTSTDPAYPRLRRPEEVSKVSRTSSEDNDKDDKYYAEHWNYKLVKQVPRFRQLVQQRMVEIFKASPSMLLYTLILALSPDVQSVTRELHEILSWLAPASTNSLATALGIYCTESKFDEVASLLESHVFLLRPRESYAIHESVRALATSHKPAHRELALLIAEKQLLDALESIRHTVLGPFPGLDSEESHSAFWQIEKLSSQTAERQERVRRLVESVSTPGMGDMNPLAVAAMMMGMPIPIPIPIPAQGDGAGFNEAAEAAIAAATAAVAAGAVNVGDANVGIDLHDPDLSELQEDIKPDLKNRFEAWVETIKFFGYLRAATILGEGDLEDVNEGRKTLHQHADEVVKQESAKGEEILARVYGSMYTSMPWVLAPDLTDELIAKLIDRPSNHHICEALRSVASFVRTEKRKIWKAIAIAEVRASRAAAMMEREYGEARSQPDATAADSSTNGEANVDTNAVDHEHDAGTAPAAHHLHVTVEDDSDGNVTDSGSDDGVQATFVHVGSILENEIEALQDAFSQLLAQNPAPVPLGFPEQEAENTEPHSGEAAIPAPEPGPAPDYTPGPPSFLEHIVYVDLEDVD